LLAHIRGPGVSATTTPTPRNCDVLGAAASTTTAASGRAAGVLILAHGANWLRHDGRAQTTSALADFLRDIIGTAERVSATAVRPQRRRSAR
jgi:hypothetical protein